MKTVCVECPDELHERLRAFVDGGWAHDPQKTMIEALRRFLDSHSPAVIEEQVMRDVEWGLHGDE